MFYKDSALLLDMATADSYTKAPVDGSWQLQGEARGVRMWYLDVDRILFAIDDVYNYY